MDNYGFLFVKVTFFFEVFNFPTFGLGLKVEQDLGPLDETVWLFELGKLIQHIVEFKTSILVLIWIVMSVLMVTRALGGVFDLRSIFTKTCG